MSWRGIGLWLALTAFVLPATARAEKPIKFKRVRFRQRSDQITFTVGFREMFDAKLRHRLRSGFATTVVMRVYLYRKNGTRPIAVGARTLRAVYDLWDETYRLEIEGPRGRRLLKLADQSRVVDKLTSFWRFPLVAVKDIRPTRQYFIAVIVEVNPMSPQLLAAVRRWLRKPSRRRVGSESLFGSFVSIFVNDKIRRAEKTFKFRSQPFFRRR